MNPGRVPVEFGSVGLPVHASEETEAEQSGREVVFLEEERTHCHADAVVSVAGRSAQFSDACVQRPKLVARPVSA